MLAWQHQTADMEDKLLPFTKEWLLAADVMSLDMYHPTVDGKLLHDHCTLTLVIRRSFLVLCRLVWDRTSAARDSLPWPACLNYEPRLVTPGCSGHGCSRLGALCRARG